MTFTFKLSRRLAVIFLSAVLALALVALGFLLGSSSDSVPQYIQDWLTALRGSSLATRAFYFFIVGLGCAAGRVFPFQQEFQGSRDFLKHMFPGHPPVFYQRADFILTCVMGSILGMLIVQPTSVHTALATGLGWPFIVRFLLEGMKTQGGKTVSGKR
jgi:hypothetical protein